VEDDVDIWRYAIVSCMPETTTTQRHRSVCFLISKYHIHTIPYVLI